MNEIDILRATVTGLSLSVPRWVEDLVGADDPTALLLLLDDLRRLRQELATVESYVESQAARAMPRNRLTLPDGRVVIRRGSGYKRKDWQHDRILALLWLRAVEFSGGDLDEAVNAYRRAVTTHAGIGYWRDSLRVEGLELDEFCSRESARRTIQITEKPSDGAA